LSSTLTIRPAQDQDCRLLWQWANDPDTRTSAFQSDPISWDEHVAWFRRKIHDPNCHLYILGDQRDEPIGQVRFDVQEDRNAIVDITIAPGQRGRGYGPEALRLACRTLFRVTSAREAIAYIKPENAPSIRAFENAGFSHQGTTRIKGQEAVCMTWRPEP
jgi:RimJ/RimL family protein N-acetyltransferase